ncbi:MAG: GWxTD domain-containing protein [Candidatus Electryonea clarkiae]|nr:GWxTD domain-containing protein [Candidatus Electryonea clarkiae]MDP8289129.1 GWxTD domain-containing protein [Candidatus Electryonea clarkiae]
MTFKRAASHVNALSAIAVLILVLFSGSTLNAAEPITPERQSVTAELQLEKFQPVRVKFFTIDYAIFKYNEEYLQLELFALVDRQFLATDSVKTGVMARYRIAFQVFRNDTVLTGDTWTRDDFSATLEERSGGQKIPELMKYVILPGDYRVEIVVVDLVAGVYRSEDIRVHAELFSNSEVAISDIIIASKVEKTKGDAGEFDHNGLLVLPYSDRIFGLNVTTLYFYTEIYNLSVSDSGRYSITREVFSDNGEKAIELDPVTRNTKASDLVEHGGFSVANLSTGAYSLKIRVVDEVTGISDEATRTFWVFRPEEATHSPMLADPGFDIAAMTKDEIEFELKVIRYLISTKVVNAIKILDHDEKRSFLARFWISNDPNRDTKINEYREAYMDRVETANGRFGSLNREGWKTDLGRIYCLNGEPDDIEDHTFEMSSGKAYQIWSYHSIEGGIQYVFVDRNNYGDYVLVHSTKNGEVYNPNWRTIELQGF